MKKYIISAVVVLALVFYVVFVKNNSQTQLLTVRDATAIDSTASAPQETTNPGVNSNDTGATTPPTPIPTQVSGQYKDGAYTGSVADAYYGLLQVRAVVQNGKITDVQFLQYPSDRGQSIEINSFSSPRLRQEAISAQNANVNIVSGATQSSLAFRESLGSALTHARYN